jgi:hypothetical protein
MAQLRIGQEGVRTLSPPACCARSRQKPVCSGHAQPRKEPGLRKGTLIDAAVIGSASKGGKDAAWAKHIGVIRNPF